MKQVLLALLIGFSVSLFAQEENKNAEAINKYKEEGNAAYKDKNYEEAFKAYAEALKLLDTEGTVDEALIYNAGYCAFKAKKYNDAIPYFEKSIELGYKQSKPYQLLAVVYYKANKVDDMITNCEAGLKKYPNDAKLKDLTSKAYVKKGLTYYNKGNSIKKTANESGWNESDPEKFTAEYAKADEEFKNALPFFEKAYEINNKSKKALKALENIYRNLDMTEKADEAKAKLDAM